MRRTAAVLIAAAALAGPAGAPAASIYYSCGDAICRVAPDGSGRTTVVSGRTYRSPSVSLDGLHLAWIEPTADLFTGDGTGGNPVGPLTRFAVHAVISPDGSQVLALEGAGQPARICVYAIAGGDCDSQAGGSVLSAGWAPGNRVMISTRDSGDPAFTGRDRYYDNTICLLKPSGGETGGECESTMAYDADSQLLDPALSPDGTTLAVSRAPWDAQDSRQIALFDVATGNLKQVLTSGPGDGTPFWSPDGSQIAFSRDNGIFVISANGPEGSETRIADGSSPTWSNAGAVTAKPTASAAKTQRGPTVRGTITTAKGGKLVVRLLVRSGRSLLVVGQSVRALPKGGKQPWSATLSKKVRKALKGRRVPVIVQLTLTPPGGAAVTLLKKVTLRP